MEEVLEIENFGPISKAKINLKKYIVLIGPQSSGKSTIAKLIALFRSFSLFERRKEHDLERHLYELGMKNYLMPNTKITYKSSLYSFVYSQEKSSIKFVKEKTADFIRFEYPLFARDRFDLKERRHFLRMIQHDFHGEDFKMDLSYYIPAERVIVSLIAEKSFSFFRYQKELKLPIVVSDFGIQYQAALDEEYYNRRKMHSINKLKTLGNSRIHLSIENSLPKINVAHGPMLDLAESSSGVQSLIPLLLVADYIFNGNDDYESKEKINIIRNTLIVEEPEQNLFPQTQKELIYDLVAMCTPVEKKKHLPENQLVICTHSPYTLSCFNNLLMAGQKVEKFKKSVEKILDSEAYINASDFAAYYINPGKNRASGSKAISIMDKHTGLIGENALDDVSVPIMNEFERLLDL